MELRTGNFGTPTVAAAADVLAALTPELFFDALAIQVDGPAAWQLDIATRWVFPDHGKTFRGTLRNGVLSYMQDGAGAVTLKVTVRRRTVGALARGDVQAAVAGGVILHGDASALKQLLDVLRPGDPHFNIIEP